MDKVITLEQMMKKRFLYEETEVQLTGRYAKKTNRSREMMKFEITPTNVNASPRWKRWVMYDDLYEIHHPLSKRVEFATDLLDAVRRVRDNRKG